MPHLSISVFYTSVQYSSLDYGGWTMWDFQALELRHLAATYIPNGDIDSILGTFQVTAIIHAQAIEMLSSNIGKVANHLEEHISEPKTDIDIVGEWLKVMSKIPE